MQFCRFARWESEEDEQYRMFQELLDGTGAGPDSSSRPDRKLLKAKGRVVPNDVDNREPVGMPQEVRVRRFSHRLRPAPAIG